MSALGPQLLGHLAEPVRVALAEDPALEPTLEGLVERARQTWPDLEVPTADFIAVVAASLTEPSLAALGQLQPGDMLLACAARRGDPRAVRLIDQYLGRLDPMMRSVGLAPHEVDEVKQQLRERLLVDNGDRRAKLASYAGRGPLKHWLRIVVVRYAREWRATQHNHDQLIDTFTSALQQHADAEDPDLAHVRERYGALFREALAAALGTLDPDERELIRKVVSGVSPADLGQALGVHRTTALRRLDRARLAVREELKTQLKQRLAIDRFAADSLLRLYDTGFQLDLDGLLDPA